MMLFLLTLFSIKEVHCFLPHKSSITTPISHHNQNPKISNWNTKNRIDLTEKNMKPFPFIFSPENIFINFIFSYKNF